MKDHFSGLTTVQVEQSRRQYGINRLTKKKKDGFFKQLLSNFGDPIIKVLLAALAVNLIFLIRSHDWFETIGIGIAVFLATLVSTVSEYGSETAFEKLQEEANNLQCRVRRNGITVSLPIDEIVMGDIVLLQAGESVPADGELVDGRLTVDQSAINGESNEVEKSLVSDSFSNDHLSPTALLRGSIVCSGTATMRVTQIGDYTHYGKVATEIQSETRESPLKLRLSELAKRLSILGFVAAGCVAVSDLFHSLVMANGYSVQHILSSISSPHILIGHILHALMLAITVIVVAVPEGLPMMITVVLSSNMRRMLKDHVLVRKLVGIETSGSLNILFTDKTGTLTLGKPTVTAFIDGNGVEHQKQEPFFKTRLWEYICLSGYYNTDCEYSGKTVLGGNPTERALLMYIRGRHPINARCTVTDKQPFDSDKKYSLCCINGDFFTPDGFTPNEVTLYKGAPDRLLSLCTRHMDGEGRLRVFTQQSPVFQTIQKLERESKRLVALVISNDKPQGLPTQAVLIGIAVLNDEVRRDVRHSVMQVKQAGIQVVMITGDSRETASSVARKAGILQPHNDETAVVTGEELGRMSDDQLCKRLPSLRVIARALPSDKSRLIKAAQRNGLVVGMTGDGINDAPALKIADVGFSMGSGTEIAKQASDIVILNDHFASIAKSILYGRTIFKSIRKFIVFQLTMNLCAVGISIIGPFLGVEAPVTVMQMLWINIIMDTLAGLAFAGEPPLEEYMLEKPKQRFEPILNRYMLSQILCTGCFTIVLCALFLRSDTIKTMFRHDESPLFWLTGFFALFVFSGIFNSLNARTTRLNLLSKLTQNKGFVWIMTIVFVVQVLLIYWGGGLFRTATLTVKELVYVLALSLLVIPADWLRKIILRFNHRKGTL